MTAAEIEKAVRDADALAEHVALARRAHQMKVAGKSWWTIAEELGITPGEASKMVAQSIRVAAELVADHDRFAMLTLELERLDELQAAHWDRATASWTRTVMDKEGVFHEIEEPPDPKAAELVLKVMAQRDKFVNMSGLAQANTERPDVTVVVASGQTEEEYVAALQTLYQRTIRGTSTEETSDGE